MLGDFRQLVLAFAAGGIVADLLRRGHEDSFVILRLLTLGAAAQEDEAGLDARAEVGEGGLRQADHGKQLEPLQQVVANILKRRVGQDAVREYHSGAPCVRLEELANTLDEQDFGLLVLTRLALALFIFLTTQNIIC